VPQHPSSLIGGTRHSARGSAIPWPCHCVLTAAHGTDADATVDRAGILRTLAM
jgi:hypothetical protein